MRDAGRNGDAEATACFVLCRRLGPGQGKACVLGFRFRGLGFTKDFRAEVWGSQGLGLAF